MNVKDMAMPFDFTAYLADTTHLNTVEHGAYLLLFGAMWRSPDGHIESDDSYLARVVKLPVDKWKRAAKNIRPLLQVRADGKISQKKLLSVRAEVEAANQATTPAQSSGFSEKSIKSTVPSKSVTPDAPLLSSLESSVEIPKKEKKGRKGEAQPLPADWVPADAERLYGKSKCHLTDDEIEYQAEKLRRWAFNNAHLAKGRKPRWDLCFRNFLDGAAIEKKARMARQNGSGSRGRVSFGDMMRDTMEDMGHDPRRPN